MAAVIGARLFFGALALAFLGRALTAAGAVDVVAALVAMVVAGLLAIGRGR